MPLGYLLRGFFIVNIVAQKKFESNYFKGISQIHPPWQASNMLLPIPVQT